MSKFTQIRKEMEQIHDIDMTPVMSLFVILIPFLLLAAVFVKINIINSPFPQPSSASVTKKDNFSLSLYITKSGFSIETIGKNNKKNTQTIPLKEGKYQFDDLHNRLVVIKKNYSDEYRLNLYPDPGIEYETIVEVMDSTRNMNKEDPVIYVKNDEGKNIRQEFLFPDVVWMGVLD